jgi:hypothetical protein
MILIGNTLSQKNRKFSKDGHWLALPQRYCEKSGFEEIVSQKI